MIWTTDLCSQSFDSSLLDWLSNYLPTPIQLVLCIVEWKKSCDLKWIKAFQDNGMQWDNSVAWVRERTIPTKWPPLSAKSVPTFADRGYHVRPVRQIPTAVFFGFLDRRCYFFFQAATHLYSRGWVDPVRDPLLLRESGNRTLASESVATNSDH
jgi:hypothetical protein